MPRPNPIDSIQVLIPLSMAWYCPTCDAVFYNERAPICGGCERESETQLSTWLQPLDADPLMGGPK